MLKFIAIVSSLMAVLTANAEILVQYNTNTGGTQGQYRTKDPQAATTIADHIAAESLTPYRLGALSDNSNAGGMGFLGTWGYLGNNSFRDGNPADAKSVIPVASDNFFSFNLNVANGYAADIESLSFSYRTPGFTDGTVYFDIRSSMDNYASSLHLLTLTTEVTAMVQTGDLSLATLADITGSIDFRIYIYRANGTAFSSGDARIAGITVNGGVVAVPEAGSIAALLALAVAVPVVGRRLRRR